MATVKGTLGKSDVFKIDPCTVIIKEGWNPREDYGDLEGLADSIAQNGVRTPIIVKRLPNGDLELVAGERRVLATRMAIDAGAEILAIPAFIRTKTFSRVDALVDATLENEGKPFTPLELSEVYRRFVAWGWTQAQIATRFGKSQGHVAQILSLLNATTPVREAITNGELTAKEGMDIVRTAKVAPDPVTAQQVATERKKEAKVTQKAERKAARASGVNPIFVNMLKEEFAQNFESIAEYRTLSAPGQDTYTNREMHIYSVGRLALLCELCGDGKDLEDLQTLLG